MLINNIEKKYNYQKLYIYYTFTCAKIVISQFIDVKLMVFVYIINCTCLLKLQLFHNNILVLKISPYFPSKCT